MSNGVREPTYQLSQEDMMQIRQMWDAGIASGSAGEVSLKKLRREARTRLKDAKVVGNAD